MNQENRTLGKEACGEIYDKAQPILEGNLKTLKEAAENFLEVLDNAIEGDLKHRDKLASLLAEEAQNNIINQKNSSAEISKEIQDEQKKTVSILDATMAFQQAIKNFLGIAIQISWVGETGKIYMVSEETESKLLKENKNFDKQRLRYKMQSVARAEGAKTFNNFLKEQQIEMDNKKILLEHYKKVRNFYQKVVKTKFEPSITPSIYSPTVGKRTIMTSEGADTIIINQLAHFLVYKERESSYPYIFNYFSNWGMFNEGYVALVMDYHIDNIRKIFEGSDEDKKAKILYNNYISQVDNFSGVLGGDVKTKLSIGGLSLELAVKSGSFSSQSFGSLVDIAEGLKGIEKLKDGKEKEEFIKIFSSKSVTYMNQISKKTLEKTIENIKKYGAENNTQNLEGVVFRYYPSSDKSEFLNYQI